MAEGTLKDRVIQFIDYLGIPVQAFERNVGLSNASVSKMGDNTRRSTIDKISKKYPKLNTNWLMTGEGEMLKSETSNVTFVGHVTPAIIEDTVAVRYFEVTPTATFQEFCEGMNEDPDTLNVYPESNEVLDDTYCAFNVWGDSMAPQIHSKTRVLCREIPPTRWHNLSDCVVVIAYADKFVVKRIVVNRLSSENYLILASDNPDYPDRNTVQLADIRAIFRAERIISSKIV